MSWVNPYLLVKETGRYSQTNKPETKQPYIAMKTRALSISVYTYSYTPNPGYVVDTKRKMHKDESLKNDWHQLQIESSSELLFSYKALGMIQGSHFLKKGGVRPQCVVTLVDVCCREGANNPCGASVVCSLLWGGRKPFFGRVKLTKRIAGRFPHHPPLSWGGRGYT